MTTYFAVRAIALYQCTNLDMNAPDAIHLFYELAMSGNPRLEGPVQRETFEDLTALKFYVAKLHKKGTINDNTASLMYQAADRAGLYGTLWGHVLVKDNKGSYS